VLAKIKIYQMKILGLAMCETLTNLRSATTIVAYISVGLQSRLSFDACRWRKPRNPPPPFCILMRVCVR
jgi:hypothetical protein